MIRLKIKLLPLFFLLAFIILLMNSCKFTKSVVVNPPRPLIDLYEDTLTVAPYLYVPRLNQFTDYMREVWAQTYPNTYLQIDTNWDCYSADPPDSIDVFVYDGIFFNYFLAQNYIQPIPQNSIENFTDILPYAQKAGSRNDILYAVPQIGCGNILFYRNGDEELNQVQSYQAMLDVLGLANYTTVRPPIDTGLMIDFSGGTTSACYYVSVDMQISNEYSPINPPQQTCETLHQNTIDSLQLLVAIAGKAQAANSDAVPYQRAIWFSEGTARAMVGFTESLNAMGPNSANVNFKFLPLGGASFTPFYVDMASINSKLTDQNLLTKAQSLVRILTSSDFAIKTFGPSTPGGMPQYLMPVRTSVFQTLGASFPLYKKMENLVQTANPKAFLLNENARTWLSNTKGCIRDSILNGPTPDVSGVKD